MTLPLEVLGQLEPDLLEELRDTARHGITAYMRECRFGDVEDFLLEADGNVGVVSGVSAPADDDVNVELIICADIPFHEDSHVSATWNHLVYLGTMEDGPSAHFHVVEVAAKPAGFDETQAWNEAGGIPADVQESLTQMIFRPGSVARINNGHPHRLYSVCPAGKTYGLVVDGRPDHEAREDDFRAGEPRTCRTAFFVSVNSDREMNMHEVIEIACGLESRNNHAVRKSSSAIQADLDAEAIHSMSPSGMRS